MFVRRWVEVSLGEGSWEPIGEWWGYAERIEIFCVRWLEMECGGLAEAGDLRV